MSVAPFAHELRRLRDRVHELEYLLAITSDVPQPLQRLPAYRYRRQTIGPLTARIVWMLMAREFWPRHGLWVRQQAGRRVARERVLFSFRSANDHEIGSAMNFQRPFAPALLSLPSPDPNPNPLQVALNSAARAAECRNGHRARPPGYSGNMPATAAVTGFCQQNHSLSSWLHGYSVAPCVTRARARARKGTWLLPCYPVAISIKLLSYHMKRRLQAGNNGAHRCYRARARARRGSRKAN